MSSLFARIWLSYWLAMAVALVAASLVTLGLAVERVETLVARENFGLLEFFYGSGFEQSQRLSFAKRVA